MADTDKKKWTTPKLTVFTKTRTEESVLWVCKMETSGSGFGVHYHGCYSNCSELTRCHDGGGS